MKRLCLLLLVDPKTRRPLLAGVHATGGKSPIIYDLYLPGSGLTISRVERNIANLAELVRRAHVAGVELVVSDFKEILRCLGIAPTTDRYNTYDLLLDLPDCSRPRRAKRALCMMLEQMLRLRVHEYQRVTANAAVVYQAIEDRGVLRGGLLEHPQWSQRTVTGRSKVTGSFNIQGIERSSREHIGNPNGAEEDVLIHFDWVSADIRMAAHFSGDDRLNESFRVSDPYTYLMDNMGLITGDRVVDEETRKSCKVSLLSAINGLDVTSPVFDVYPQLGEWIRRCRRSLSAEDGYLDTILGRRFRMRNRDSKLQVLNACMQGSVAHAMQLAVRRIWELVGDRLLAEVHDSLVLACPDRSAMIQGVIRQVGQVMLHPFRELAAEGLCEDPDFPFRVSVGKLWHGWEPVATHRAGGVEEFRGKCESCPAGAEGDAPPETETTAGAAPEATSRAAINAWFA